MDAKEIVRAGYNKIVSAYGATRTLESTDVQLLHLLVERLPRGAMVFDAGCGSGYPVARFLAEFFRVTGMDFAEEQIRAARRMVPDANFICGDITSLPFRDNTFDTVVSYYAIIHIPRSKHRELLHNFVRVLRPGGLALLCMGAGDLPDDISDYHGSQMFWSHYDSTTNLRMMRESGFAILWSETIMENPASSHLFALGQKKVA